MLRQGFAFITAREARRFQRDLVAPAATQERLRRALTAAAARSEYGRAHGLTGREDYGEFAAKLPVVTYDDIAPWMARQRTSRAAILCHEAPLFYERTSGSGGPAKLIPYTRGLHLSFQRMFRLWAHDLAAQGPSHGLRVGGGPVFFSISPALMGSARTESGAPIGLPDDTGYLAGLTRVLFRRLSAVPTTVKSIKDPAIHRLVVAECLLSCRDLEVISVWDPSYLEILLDFMEELRGPQDWAALWPRLKLVSCWGDGHAAGGFERLRRRLPAAVHMQAKGLLATEAPLTIPLLGHRGCAPLLQDVFFEFTEDGSSRALRLHELREGCRYGVIISQRGGLTRYALGDTVEVTGFVGATPLLAFRGRSAVSSLVGEKLSETFVGGALATLSRGGDAFQVLVPEEAEGTRRYVLVTDTGADAAALEEGLSCAYHYRHARLLGQLAPSRVVHARLARDHYYEVLKNRGMKWGDIKPRALITDGAVARDYLSAVSAQPS